jgi:crossover junction endodeoxyribonuclease RuvC
MLRTILKFEETPKFLDATDALGVAVCHYFQTKALSQNNSNPDVKVKKQTAKKSKASWSSFINKNPDRIKK